MSWFVSRVVTSALLCCTALAAPAAAAGEEFAPVDRPGPALSVPGLAGSVQCDDDAATAPHAPVLLTAGTTVTTREDFGWNWIPALRARGFPVCTVDAPGRAAENNIDIQERAEYVVHAIRRAYEAGGRRKIAIYGHSQGGQVMRWPLRFFPDTRAMVEDVVSVAATHHGSPLIHVLCTPNCTPALWQQLPDSDYLRALNSRQETFAGISYTNVYTRTDQFVQPNLDDSGTSSLRTGDGRITNVAVQEVCAANLSEHLLVATSDPVTWALGLDALTHDGPADPARLPADVCDQQLMPGVSKETFLQEFGAAGGKVLRGLTVAPRVDREPELRCYVLASCPVPATTAPTAKACTRTTRRVALPAGTVRVRRGDRRLAVRRTAAGRRVVVVRFPRGAASVRLRVTRRVGGRTTTRTLRVARC